MPSARLALAGLAICVALPVAAQTPLGAALREAAHGAPVFFVRTPEGLIARTPDGALSRVVAPGPFTDVQWDAAHDVLWLVAASEVKALDLQADGAPVTVITGLPRTVAFRPVFGAVEPPDALRPDVGGGSSTLSRLERLQPTGLQLNSHAELALEIAARPRLHPAVVQGVDYAWWYEGGKGAAILAAQAKQARRARLVGAQWVKTLAARPTRDGGPGLIEPGVGPRVALPHGLGACEDDHACGQSAPFGPWSLVVVSHECGDFCYLGCVLHNAATGKFMPAPGGANTGGLGASESAWTDGKELTPGGCGDFWLSRDNRHVLVGTCLDDRCSGQVCALGGPCAALPGPPVGWLEPGARFELLRPHGPP